MCLEFMKRTMACLMASNLVYGRPLMPVAFISTRDSGSMSMQKSISSLFNRAGCSTYLFCPAELSTSSPSISLPLLRLYTITSDSACNYGNARQLIKTTGRVSIRRDITTEKMAKCVGRCVLPIWQLLLSGKERGLCFTCSKIVYKMIYNLST